MVLNEKMVVERRENVELLTENHNDPGRRRSQLRIAGAQYEPPAAPDGGIKAYTVALASFLTNGLVFGIINSYSIIYTVLVKRLNDSGSANAEVKASLVGSLTIGTTFALSPVSGILTGFFGLRLTAVLGGAIATFGMLVSSFVIDYVYALCFTYGILFGLGASLAYTPSLAILGQYFKKYLGIVNGIVTVGSSLFTVFMPMVIEWMINNHGLEWMFRLLSVFTIGIMFCGLLFAPVPVLVIEKPLKSDISFKQVINTIGCFKMWKIKRYKLWALSMPVALFGYFVPYVHLKELILSSNFPGTVNYILPIQCIAVTSALGRITFGLMADCKRINRIFLQQISFYVIGTLTIILPFVKSFGLVIAISLGMGLFEGGFIALLGPIAFELVGTAYMAQAIGCMLGLAALPLSIGPSIAGAIYNVTKNYTLPFVLAGLSPITGATIMCLIHLTKKTTQAPETNTNGHALTLNESDVDKAPVPLIPNGQA